MTSKGSERACIYTPVHSVRPRPLAISAAAALPANLDTPVMLAVAIPLFTASFTTAPRFHLAWSQF